MIRKSFSSPCISYGATRRQNAARSHKVRRYSASSDNLATATPQPEAQAPGLAPPAPSKPLTRKPTALGLSSLETRRITRETADNLNDTLVFTAQAPADDEALGHTAKLSGNGLKLGDPGLEANIARGSVNLSSQHTTRAGDVVFTLARNLGGNALSSRFDVAQHDGGNLALSLGGGGNGNTLGVGPVVSLQSPLKDEAGVGSGVFSTGEQALTVTSEKDARVTMRSSRAVSQGGALDPLGALHRALHGIPMGAFARFARSQGQRETFDFEIHTEAARALLQRHADGGLLKPLKQLLRNWASAFIPRNTMVVRPPNLQDPFGDAGGRGLRTNETLVVHKNGTVTWGLGGGIAGLRVGRYHSHTDEWEYRLTALPNRRLKVIITPRQALASTNSFDAPITPAWQDIDSKAVAWRWEGTFDFSQPADVQAYRRLLVDGTVPMNMALDPEAPVSATDIAQRVRADFDLPTQTLSQAITQAQHNIRGILRWPFVSGHRDWAGIGDQSIKTLVQQASSDGNTSLQSHAVSVEESQHRLQHGVFTTRYNATVRQDNTGLQGVELSMVRAATRPTPSDVHAMIADAPTLLGRPLRASASPSPQVDRQITFTLRLTSQDLERLARVPPQKTQQVATAQQADASLLSALVSSLRGVKAPDQPRTDWLRGKRVSDYLLAGRGAGLAALTQLLNKRTSVATSSASYTQPLTVLPQLRVHGDASSKLSLLTQFETALAALQADPYPESHRKLETSLRAGIRELCRMLSPSYLQWRPV